MLNNRRINEKVSELKVILLEEYKEELEVFNNEKNNLSELRNKLTNEKYLSSLQGIDTSFFNQNNPINILIHSELKIRNPNISIISKHLVRHYLEKEKLRVENERLKLIENKYNNIIDNI